MQVARKFVYVACKDEVNPKSKWFYPKIGFASWWVWSQKTQSSQRAGEGRMYYLQQVRRKPGMLPKAMSPQTVKLGKS